MSVQTYDLGTVLMVPKGDWDSTVSYERLNLVRHNGTAWLCTVAAGSTSLNEEPSLNATNWELLVSDQSSVTSVNGLRGDVDLAALDETISGDKTFTGQVDLGANATATTPDEDDESNSIATTEWVKNTTLTNAAGGYNLFDVKWADHRLNDMSWLRSDTFSWHNGDVYSAAYEELLAEYNNENSRVAQYEQEVSWQQPYLTANGTLGGNSFAVQASSEYSTDHQAYHAFSGPAADWVRYGSGTATFTFYNPYPIRVTKLQISPRANRASNNVEGFLGYQLQGSNDNSTWTTLGSVSVTSLGAAAPFDLNVDNSDYYKYYRLNLSSPQGNNPGISNIKIFAKKWLTTFQYKKSPKGYNIATPDCIEAIRELFDEYGIAWFYILDTTNKRFKLPRTKFAFTGLRSGVGNFVDAGLPGIGHRHGYNDIIRTNTQKIGTGAASASATATAITSKFTEFPPHTWSDIYGRSNTVQPPATEMYLYHYVGDFNRQAVLATIGVTSENIDSTSFLNTPVGTIIWSMANSIPSGYLLCNGQAVGRLAYPELFSAIGTTYGEGDGDSTFNLPNLIGKFVEGNATAGIEHEAGLPNITGSINVLRLGSQTTDSNLGTGCISLVADSSDYTVSINTQSGVRMVKNASINASRSSSVYKDDCTTVQPPSLTAMPCIKAFDAVVNEGTVEVSELVNNVLKLDGSNTSSISSELNEYLAHSAMPSEQYIDLTLPASRGTVTAPADGWITLLGMAPSGSLSADNLVALAVRKDNSSSGIPIYQSAVEGNRSGDGISALLPVSAGQIVFVYYAGSFKTGYPSLTFTYANGTEHLAPQS